MIYCLEDDDAVRNMVLYTLTASGLPAVGFASAEPFFEAVAAELPQLVLLDIMLPGEDGISVLRRLRANPVTESVPVILATAKGTEYDKVTGLDSGADDYLVKPFGMMEMVSRVKAVLRRAAPAAPRRNLTMGDLALDLSAHEVSVCGRPVQLTLKEFELLRLFMENPGRVFTRSEMIARVWQSDYFGETRTVDVHIGTLRTNLAPLSDYIETVRGVGYRMSQRRKAEEEKG